MGRTAESSAVRGKTIRFAWTDGPTKGTTHEHVFHDDGTVEWHGVESREPRKTGKGAETERPKYADEEIAEGIRMISYLARSGYTLTVVLNFESGAIAGIASNEKTWMPVHGTFEVVY
jgi:hypothetical protein